MDEEQRIESAVKHNRSGSNTNGSNPSGPTRGNNSDQEKDVIDFQPRDNEDNEESHGGRPDVDLDQTVTLGEFRLLLGIPLGSANEAKVCTTLHNSPLLRRK